MKMMLYGSRLGHRRHCGLLLALLGSFTLEKASGQVVRTLSQPYGGAHMACKCVIVEADPPVKPSKHYVHDQYIF